VVIIAKELNFPVDTVRAWIRMKKLKAYRPGKGYRFKRHDSDKFLAQNTLEWNRCAVPTTNIR
jgi:excisionase family DNA binding protein